MTTPTNPFSTPTIGTSDPYDVQSAVPNFMDAATQQAGGNLTGAQLATEANRPNQYNPFGSQTWAQDPTTGMWSQTVAFSPEQQTIWNQFMQSGQQFGDATNTALSNWQNPQYGGIDPSQFGATAAQAWQTPQSYGGVNLGQMGTQAQQQYGATDRYGGITPNAAGLQQVADTLYGTQTARLDPQFAEREQSLYTQLYNQGLRPGTEAWTNAARDFNNARNDAYQQARGQAMQAAQAAQGQLFGMGQQAQNQAYQQAMGAYGAGLGGNQNAYNQMAGLYGMGLQGSNAAFNQALGARGQTAPQMPQFNQFYTQQPTTGPNYLGALGQSYQGSLDVYNADVARQNAMLQGLYGLGTGILGLPTGSGTTLGGQLLSGAGGALTNWLKGLLDPTYEVGDIPLTYDDSLDLDPYLHQDTSTTP